MTHLDEGKPLRGAEAKLERESCQRPAQMFSRNSDELPVSRSGVMALPVPRCAVPSARTPL